MSPTGHFWTDWPRFAIVQFVGCALLLSSCFTDASSSPYQVDDPAVSSPMPSPGKSPPVAGIIFPDASNTGVPANTVLRESGSITIRQDGAVLDALHVTGTVKVAADNVTIRKSLVDNTGLYPIRLVGGHRNLVIEDTEINGNGKGSSAVCCDNFTLRRVNIHDVFEGPRLNGNVMILDSYVHHLLRCEWCHIDCVQTTGGSNIVVRGNNLQAYNPDIKYLANAAYQIGTSQGSAEGILVENNLLNGGNFTLNAGGGRVMDGAEAVFRGNRFGRDFRYGPVTNIGPRSNFDDSNVWNDTGLPVLG